MSFSDVIDAMKKQASFSISYEGADGISYHAVDSFRVWRSLPEQLRVDLMSIIWKATVKSGDKHLRNGGQAVFTFLEFLTVACNDRWVERPVMQGDHDAAERRAERESLERRVNEAGEVYFDLVAKLEALTL